MKWNKDGFTLMEVAILLVIVSVLVAIAIPQFRTAEIKSKIALVRGQLNTLALALESYYSDNDSYPLSVHSNPSAPEIADDGGPSRTSYFLLRPLTTPISYLSHIPDDPFADTLTLPAYDLGYNRFGRDNAGYAYRHTKGTNRNTFPYYEQYGQEWMLASVGPNRRFDSWGTGRNNLVFYDPTNGIISNGDIIRMQRGGMRN